MLATGHDRRAQAAGRASQGHLCGWGSPRRGPARRRPGFHSPARRLSPRSEAIQCPDGPGGAADAARFQPLRRRPGCQGALWGTPPYMPPEQLPVLDEERRFDPSILDARSDIFSLGAILYELLSGKKPFGSLPANLPRKDIGDCLLARQRLGPRPLGEANPDVDAPFARLVESCLAFCTRGSAGVRGGTGRRCAVAGARALCQAPAGTHPRTVCGILFLLLAVFASALFLSLRPPLGVRQLQAGEDAYHQGRYHEAVDHFSRALEAEPTLTRALCCAVALTSSGAPATRVTSTWPLPTFSSPTNRDRTAAARRVLVTASTAWAIPVQPSSITVKRSRPGSGPRSAQQPWFQPHGAARTRGGGEITGPGPAMNPGCRPPCTIAPGSASAVLRLSFRKSRPSAWKEQARVTPPWLIRVPRNWQTACGWS